MKIAVLLSTYNGELYINELMQSIYSQVCNLEIIVCVRDDGSSDNTLKIIEKWKSKLNIRVDIGNNIGPRDSFKKLIDSAPNCDYYAFCDQDDIWHSDKISSAVQYLENYKMLFGPSMPLLYFCNASLVNSKGNKILQRRRTEFLPLLNYENVIVENPALGCEMVFNHELRLSLQKVSFIHYFMHDVVAIDLASVIGKIIYDEIPRIDYRQHLASVTQGHKKIKSFFNKLNFWFFQKDISISLQAKELLQLFPNNDKKEILNKIGKYRSGVNRFKIIFDKRFRSSNFRCNRSFILRVLSGVA